VEQEKKLLFFDIDGTLAMPGDSPSPAVVSAIRAARAKGHLVFLGTGRAEPIVDAAIMDIGFDGGIFSAGGRVVVQGEEILSTAMSADMARAVSQVLAGEEGLFYSLECGSGNFSGNMDGIDLDAMETDGASTELRRVIQVMKSSGRSVENYKGEPIYKISFFCTSLEQMNRMEQTLSSLGKVVRFDNMLPEVDLYAGEITGAGTDKGRALRAICAHCGVSSAQTVAFGDSMNDAEMLQAAGVGVAMGNAEKRVKALADRICESCAEDGIAKELAHMGLC
jgi:Cof subfamily protein (haloacid dehalogenase superfamily)